MRSAEGYDTNQIFAQIGALMAPDAAPPIPRN